MYSDFIQPKCNLILNIIQFDIGENDINEAIIKHSMDDIKTYSFFYSK